MRPVAKQQQSVEVDAVESRKNVRVGNTAETEVESKEAKKRKSSIVSLKSNSAIKSIGPRISES